MGCASCRVLVAIPPIPSSLVTLVLPHASLNISVKAVLNPLIISSVYKIAEITMARFHPLEVLEVRHDTRDAIVVTLKPSQEAQELFQFIPGQYLTFRRKFDDTEVRRSYRSEEHTSELQSRGHLV